MSSTHGTSPSLVEGLRVNRPDAWERLVLIYTPLVTAWCTRTGVDVQTAQDIVQETFFTASQKLDAMRSEAGSGSFRGWLWTIARNKLIDRSRRRCNNEIAIGGSSAAIRLTNIPDAAGADEALLEEADPSTPDLVRGLVMRAMDYVRAEFREDTWQAFWRTAIDQVPSDIVAQELGCTPAAVRQSRSRIMRRLRIELGELQ